MTKPFVADLKSNTRTTVITLLNERVADAIDLKLAVKQAHWNIRGPSFIAIHELLDNAFIMRFDTPDALRLTDALDDVIDGMRGAATHVDIYKRYLRVLRPEADELVVAAESAIRALRDLVSAVSTGPMSLNRAREGAKAINDAEANADKIIARAERNLVDEFSTMETNTLEFIALEKLYSMLEQITDDAKRCGKLIVSLIRKEA